MWLLLACDSPDQQAPVDLTPLEAQLQALEEEVERLQADLDATQAQLDATEIPERYTDDEAIAAVQNPDPFGEGGANLESLWHASDGGLWWLREGEVYMDNRRDPAGSFPSHELWEGYHETTECEAGMAFADCNATGGFKLYVNGPRITDNDWSAEGLKTAAQRSYHTHTSGMYMVSFGQVATVSDYGQLIPPSGIHLEPHGAHQGLRIDGTANSGDNIRIDLAEGATGLAVYTGGPGLYCDVFNCDTTYPLYLRGGTLHLEDMTTERSVDQHSGAGAFTAGVESLGVRRLLTWSSTTDGLLAYCVFHERADADTVVLMAPYSYNALPYQPLLLDTWDPGAAPSECAGVQSVTTSAGSYGYGTPPSTVSSLGGFRVVLVGPDGAISPPDFGEDYPVIRYELVQPI